MTSKIRFMQHTQNVQTSLLLVSHHSGPEFYCEQFLIALKGYLTRELPWRSLGIPPVTPGDPRESPLSLPAETSDGFSLVKVMWRLSESKHLIILLMVGVGC